MSYTTKRKIMNSTVYIVIALVIGAVLLTVAATVIGMQDKKKTPTPIITDPPAASSPLSPDKPADKVETPPATSPDKPVINNSPSKDTPVIEPVKPVIYLPAEGSLMKEYSIDLPVFSLTMKDYRTHNGIDISAALGSAVVCMTDGTISAVWSDPMMGMCISVDHGDGLISHYKNLASELPEGIEVGASVKAGQTIGAVGESCLIEIAESEHLHFELTKDGKHVDPLGYLDFKTKEDSES